MKPEGAGGSLVGQWGPPAPTVQTKQSIPPMENNKKPWSRQSDGFITMNYHRLTDAQMGIELGRSAKSVTDRRVKLGKKRLERMAVKSEGIWSAGKVLMSADDFVKSLSHMVTNDQLWHIDRRIDDANGCLLRLFENAPVYKTWANVEDRALQKLQACIKDLKRVRGRVRFADAFKSEAA